MRKILLSIKPYYAHAILNGSKTVEYRKVVPKEGLSGIAYIYSSSPEKKVIGEFKYKNILSMPPKILWEETKERGGIDQEFFDSYFQERNTAYAFDIESVLVYKTPKSLYDLNIKQAPQSWMYVDEI